MSDTQIARRAPTAPAMLNAYIPRQLQEAERVAKMLANSGACGRMNGGEVFAVMMAGARYNLDPITATRTFFVADGKVGIYSAGMHALVLASGLVEELTLVEDPTDNNMTRAVWRAHRKGHRSPVVVKFTQDDAKRAKLWMRKTRKGGDTPWVAYPDRMLVARALSKTCRQVWPDVVAGLYTMDEVRSGDFDPDIISAETIDVRQGQPQGNPSRPPQRAPEPHLEPPVMDAEYAEAPASAPGPTTPPTQPERPAGLTDALIEACEAAGVRLRVVEAVRDGEDRYRFNGWRVVDVNPDASRSIISTAAWFRNAAVVDAYRNADMAANVDGAGRMDLRRALCKSLHEALTARGLDQSNAGVAIAPNVTTPEWADVKAAIGRIIAHDSEAGK